MDEYMAGFVAALRCVGGLLSVAVIVVMIVALVDYWLHKEETSEKMEVIAQYPGDENRKKKICPFCGELYGHELIIRCVYDGYDLVDWPVATSKYITPALELEIPDDIKEVWEELELSAKQYGKGKPYRFTRDEVLKLCALETKWNDAKHQERKAS